jgi:hypothetical protein
MEGKLEYPVIDVTHIPNSGHILKSLTEIVHLQNSTSFVCTRFCDSYWEYSLPSFLVRKVDILLISGKIINLDRTIKV